MHSMHLKAQNTFCAIVNEQNHKRNCTGTLKYKAVVNTLKTGIQCKIQHILQLIANSTNRANIAKDGHRFIGAITEQFSHLTF
jgi:hypothetical protein